MKQYSMLWGTTSSGEYHYLWSNPDLLQFLGSVGAPDRNLAARTTQGILRAFKRYPNYQAQPSDDMPVSVHYAPMHLYKLPEFPVTMKPFAALSFTGDENRVGGRESTYSHTIVMPIDLMRGSDPNYNFLDLMFGTQLTSWQQVEAFREGWRDFQPDHPPMKVEPEFRDLNTAIYAASVLLMAKGEQNIILRLEKGCGFNRRAFELLKQIYSLLPPRLAAETGFATYHPVENIDELSRSNSIQVFVVPAEADTGLLDQNRSIILDLSREDYEPPLTKTPLTETLISWSKLPWSRRYSAYKSIFATEETDYQDSDTFVELSASFLKSAKDLDNWLSSAESEESISSLLDLEKLFAEHPAWVKIPWIKESIKEAMPDLLAEGVDLSNLLANSIATCRFAEDPEEMRKEFNRFKIGNLFAEANARMICNLVAEKQKSIAKAEEKLALDNLEAKHAVAITAKDREIARQQAVHTQEIQELQALHAAELKSKVAAHAEVERRMSAELKNINAEKLTLEEKLRKSNKMNLELQDKLNQSESDLSNAVAKIEKLTSAKRKVPQTMPDEASDMNDSDNRPHFLRRDPWWLPLAITLIIGALLVGIPWTVSSMIDEPQEAYDPDVPTASTIATTTQTTEDTTAPTEDTTAPTEVTTAPIEPEPVAFMGWDDPALVEHMLISVNGVKQVMADDSWYANDITIPEGYKVATVISSEEGTNDEGYPESYALILTRIQTGSNDNGDSNDEEYASGSGASDADSDETYADREYNSSTSDSKADTEPTEEDDNWNNRNTELTTEELFALSDKIQLVIETENQVILSVGTDKMHEVAFRTAAWSAEDESIDIQITVRLENGDLLNLIEKAQLLPLSKYWWYELEEFSTDPSHMGAIKKALNTNPYPVLSFKCVGTEIAFYDCDGNEEMAKILVEQMKEKTLVESENDIVIVEVPSSDNSTESTTENSDPAET